MTTDPGRSVAWTASRLRGAGVRVLELEAGARLLTTGVDVHAGTVLEGVSPSQTAPCSFLASSTAPVFWFLRPSCYSARKSVKYLTKNKSNNSCGR